MKNKKLLGLLLALVLCILAVPMTGLVGETQEIYDVSKFYVNSSWTSSNVPEGLTWGTNAFDSVQDAIDKAEYNVEKTIVLDADVNLTASVNITEDQTDERKIKVINLDLNGHVVDGSGIAQDSEETDPYASIITNNGTLTIQDSNTNQLFHYFKYVKDGSWTLVSTTPEQNIIKLEDFTLDAVKDTNKTYYIKVTGGTISGNTADYGGGIANNGTLTISGGTISGNAADYGSGILNSGTLTIKNGTISGNTAGYGGGILNSGTLTIKDGTISGNTAYYGGGILNSGTLTIKDGTISGNTAVFGGGINNDHTLKIEDGTIIQNNCSTWIYPDGGVYCCKGDDSSVSLSGKVVIQGNTTTLANADNKVVNANLCLDGMTEIDLVSLSDLKTDSSIGITIIMDCEPLPAHLSFTSNGTQDDVQYFFSDNSKQGVIYVADTESTGHLELTHAQHNFEYSAAGAVLTATCKASTTCALTDNKTTLTLKAPENLVYDGSPKTCTIDAEDSWTTTAGLELPTIEYYQGDTKLPGAPTNAGTYTAKITVDGETVSVGFEITQKPVTVTALDVSKDYGAADPKLKATVEGTVEGETVAYSLKRTEGKDAGAYTIIASGAQSQGNYTVSFVPGTFTINPGKDMAGKTDTTALTKIREAYQKKNPGKAVTVAMQVSSTKVNADDGAPVRRSQYR